MREVIKSLGLLFLLGIASSLRAQNPDTLNVAMRGDPAVRQLILGTLFATSYSRISDSVPIDACSLHFAFGGSPIFPESFSPKVRNRIQGEVKEWCTRRLPTPREIRGPGWYFRDLTRSGLNTLVLTAWVTSGEGSHTEHYIFRGVAAGKPGWSLAEIRLFDFVHY
jgi:hypothetical protein